MKILITGTSKGIGLALAKRYLDNGHEVYGLDLLESSINHKNYHHYMVDVSKKKQLDKLRRERKMLLQWSERDLLARRNSSGFSVLLIYNSFYCSMFFL